MNFFAHFLSDQQADRHHYNAGLILPDLIRNFLPRQRFKAENVNLEHLDEHALELFHGSCRHLERDRAFHQSPFFTQGNQALNHLFHTHQLGKHVPRVWLAAHLVLELMLDRVLMKQHPEQLDRFYESLSQTREQALDGFLLAGKHEHSTRFMEHWSRFVAVKYLYHYTDDDAFTYSMMQIYMRAGVSGEWNTSAQNAFKAVLPEAEACIFENLKIL
ncbi:MAG: hypothetical protein RLZZ370_318 [Bacteroidota bacterium]